MAKRKTADATTEIVNAPVASSAFEPEASAELADGAAKTEPEKLEDALPGLPFHSLEVAAVSAKGFWRGGEHFGREPRRLTPSALERIGVANLLRIVREGEPGGHLVVRGLDARGKPVEIPPLPEGV